MTPSTARNNSAALAFMASGAFWLMVGTSYGLFTAIHLVAPEFFNNVFWAVFGRTRPIHVNTVVFGFVAQTLMGAALYYVPALLRTSLWSQKLGWVSCALWDVAVLSGPLTFSFGVTHGREYAEYIWPFVVCMTAALLTLILNLVMTVARRRENTLYVSVWYILGATLWTACVYPIGNVIWNIKTGALPGLLDSIVLWFYGHNLVGLLLTPLALGAAYYILPRVARTPLYSHTLSLVGFWSLVAIYTHIGGHHILQTPIPNWLKTISVVDSIAMFIPVFTVLANLWLTVRGRSGRLLADPAGRWILTGTLWYLVTCVQGPVQSLPSVQQVTHFTNWVIGHSHIAVLGFAGFSAIGALWHCLPLAAGRHVWSSRLVNLQFGLVLTGLVGFALVLTIAGLIQGSAWSHGETVYKVLPRMAPYMVLRLAMGLFIVTGAYLGFYNLVMTLRRGRPLEAAAYDDVVPL